MHPNLNEAKFQHKIKFKNSCSTSIRLLLQDVMHSGIASPPVPPGGSSLVFLVLHDCGSLEEPCPGVLQNAPHPGFV